MKYSLQWQGEWQHSDIPKKTEGIKIPSSEGAGGYRKELRYGCLGVIGLHDLEMEIRMELVEVL